MSRSSLRPRIPRFARTPSGAIGLALLLALIAMAVFGPLLAPYSPDAPIGPPGHPPASGMLLGTDFLGRDVLSRLLNGGRTVLSLAIAATALCYLVGLPIGLIAGYRRGTTDAILMRSVDVLLAVPAMLLLLVIIAGLGTSIPVLLFGVVLVQIPWMTRVMRTATLETSNRAYVEAAVARGEGTFKILARDVVPNISEIILADLGIRFGANIILIASLNFLGLGLQPPTSDWGLMISENRDYMSLNIWSVLAPAAVLALLTISVNVIGDAVSYSMGRSVKSNGTRRRGLIRRGSVPSR
jgi:ABC-type dipeptide/oligopeptide/nickel transport system permease subunit